MGDGSGEDGIADDDCGGEDVEGRDAGRGLDDCLVAGDNEEREDDGKYTASDHLG